jgi:hypothetical protein
MACWVAGIPSARSSQFLVLAGFVQDRERHFVQALQAAARERHAQARVLAPVSVNVGDTRFAREYLAAGGEAGENRIADAGLAYWRRPMVSACR